MHSARGEVAGRDSDIEMLQTCVQALQALTVVFCVVWEVVKVWECTRAASAIFAVGRAIGAAPVAARGGCSRVVCAGAWVEGAHEVRYPLVDSHVGWREVGWSASAMGLRRGGVELVGGYHRRAATVDAAGGGERRRDLLLSMSTMRLRDLQANHAERNRVSTRHQMITGGSLWT